MTRYRIGVLPVLAAAALLLGGCGAEPIDPATAGDLQAEVRTIAATAAGGDSTGAIALAERLRAEVDGARDAGTVNEDRASLIGMHIDAVIASLQAEEEPADGAPAGTPAPEPAPAGTSGPPAPAGTTPAPADPAPESPVPAPVSEAPAAPAAPTPGETDENEAEENEPDEDAGDGGAVDQGAVTPGDGGQGADKAAEQQRKAAEKAAEQARKEAERAADKAADEARGKGNGG